VSEVYDRDPDLFKLYCVPQAYRGSTQTDSTVALSSGSEFLRLFEAGPNPVNNPSAETSASPISDASASMHEQPGRRFVRSVDGNR
jgi:hypothetical protein